MGEPIFDVELFHAAYSDRHPFVALTLPAAPWEMADAMDALRLGEGERMVVSRRGSSPSAAPTAGIGFCSVRA